MRTKRDGTRFFMDESIQRQAEIVREKGKHISPTPRQMLLTHAQQFLGHLDWFAPRCKADEVLPVVTVRAALKLLIEFLERNQ